MCTVRCRLLDANVEIRCDDRSLGDLVEYVLRDVPAGDEPAADSADAVLEMRRVSADVFAIEGPTAWAGEVPADQVVPRLLTILNALALRSVKDELCVHGAGVVVHGALHALVAPSGVGKTTLLIALMKRGAAALNDELLRVAPDGTSVRGWPKPLSIKPGTAELFPELTALTPDDSVPFRHVPLSAVGSVALGPQPVSSVVLLRRREGDRPGFADLSAPEALVALAGNTMNFATVGPQRSLTTLAALVASRPTRYFDIASPLESAEVLVDDALGGDVRTLEWDLLDTAAPYAVDGVLTVRIEDETVLWSPVSQQTIALDPIASELWLAACWGESDRLVDEADFARSLVDQGMLDLDRTLEAKRLNTGPPS